MVRHSSIAAALVIIGLFLVGVFDGSEPDYEEVKRYVTRVGEQKKIQLDDGSQLILNTNSSVLVNVSEGNRSVSLVHGEALFDVVKDETSPFTVAVEERVVTVLGTKFSVFKESGAVTVSVAEGRVAVSSSVAGDDKNLHSFNDLQANGDDKIDLPNYGIIESGLSVTFGTLPESVESNAIEDINEFFSWERGVLKFENITLSAAVKILNRYSPKKILIEDKKAMDLNVFAVIRIDSINTALRGLEKTTPIRILNQVDRIIINSK